MDRFKKITKQTNNRYLNMYALDAVKRNGDTFGYFFASRSEEEDLKLHTHDNRPDGVVIYGVTKNNDRLVLVRQFRYPINDYIYELPAGILEKGEDAQSAGVREFKEETGMDFSLYEGGDAAYRRPFFTTVGLTDESVACVFGTASGEPSLDLMEDTEDIEVILADKDEVRRILREENVAMKCALLMMSFLASEGKEPFSFLE